MDKDFDVQAYMTKGVERVVSDALRSTLDDPYESAFMLRFAAASKKASSKRARAKERGENIPPFLIASITSSCNLHCAGCYSRCNNATLDEEPVMQLSAKEWSRIFKEAEDLGISFILLAGGEPLLRCDVIEEASGYPNILFPIFTNGTFMTDSYLELLDKNRNLIPVLSIEGDKETTDLRRGEGVYDILMKSMDSLLRRKLIFGVSITVTSSNVREVTSEDFISRLRENGCKLVLYVEYVPVDDDAPDLAPGDEERQILNEAIASFREREQSMVFVSFPGDEKSSGGCIAAGRGFFHINSHGGAEPCPFSPYSDMNVRDTSLKEAMRSKLFEKLREGDYLKDDHEGGCVLYARRAQVEGLLRL
ncbi:MAG: radical SAM protein [Clostridiales bacterium]|nr:radical SAM protein [Clostridiales bacterium]